jgi:superoxide dismutase, Fe-Mn family
MPTYALPDLPYDYAALEPHISGRIMELHHDKHHAAYVAGANAAVDALAEARASGDLGAVNLHEKNLAFHLGGHVNHTIFWNNLSPDGGGEPEGELAQAIDDAFGSFGDFREKMKEAGVNQFGSGWAWLVHDGSGLAVVSTPNQDNPITDGKAPLLGVDVWEHAYYLKYQNKRPDYIDAWWNTVNWAAVEKRYSQAKAGTL